MYITRTISALLLFAVSYYSFAASPLFDNDDELKAVLSAPITQTYQQKTLDVRLYFDGAFSYVAGGTTVERIPVKVRTRGNFRRLNCTHPPLRLNFQKSKNDDNLLANQNILKLVAPCKFGRSYTDLVALEYLAYKVYEEVSDYHFKTKLIEMSYIDTDKKIEPWTAITFVIEDDDDMAKRSDLKKINVESVDRTEIDLAHTALVEVFQLLIGNTDYSTLRAQEGNCCHNVRLIAESNDSEKLIPVPYDFDASGWVNASYVKPNEKFPIVDVRERYFSGWCKEERHYNNAISIFQERKDRLYTVVKTFEHISDKSRENTISYLDSFYEILDSESETQEKVIDRCRGKVIEG